MQKITYIFTLYVLAFFFIGCGESSMQSEGSKRASNSFNQVPVDNNSGTLPTQIGDEDEDDDTPVSTKDPIIEEIVNAIGYTSASVYVQARKVLKIRFEPLEADRTPAGTNYYAIYSKLAVYLEVNRIAQVTSLLRNGVQGTAQKSSIIDMSSNIPTVSCSASNPDCRETVEVKVTRPNYDYWCYNFGGTYCNQTHTHVYPTHPWSGRLYIQTDDTDSL